jgi:hypothetical protein
MWNHLSRRTRQTITRQEFERAAPKLVEDVAKVEGGETFLEEEVGDGLTLAAMVGGPPPGAYAELLRFEEGEWKVELRTLDLIYGVSAASASDRLDFQVNAPSPVGVTGRMWLDGRPVALDRRVANRLVSFTARGVRLSPGRHTVVAFGRAGERRGAIAWIVDED